jgi:hypothetical protein
LPRIFHGLSESDIGGVREAILIILVAACFTGCATRPAAKEAKAPKEPPPTVASSEDSRLAIRNQGYSLLYKLLSDQKDVSKLLLIKKEPADARDLIKRIADVSSQAAKELEALAKADPHLHLDIDGLPDAERETRDLIAKTHTKELLTKTGEKFEMRFLLTQIEALTYGSHLAVVVQNHEADENRRAVLAKISQQYQDLHQALIDLMHTRWQMPADR